MSDDPEIIPPRRNVPAPRNEGSSVPSPYQEHIPRPAGILSSALTAWEADAEARAYGKIAERIKAQTVVLDAETERRKSALKLLRVTGELEEAPDILALDRAERRAERAAKYAELEARYDKIEDDRDERAHQSELTKLRHQRELQEARRGLVEANRDLFNSKQGLENQKRLKQLNLEMWETRLATQNMDAEKVRLLLAREIEEMQGTKDSRQGTLDELFEQRESLAARAQEAAASGDAAQAEKYLRLASELDELVAAMLQARGQK